MKMESVAQQAISQQSQQHLLEQVHPPLPQPNLNCMDCGLNFDSSKSLDVHLNYHKENLMSKWGTAASGTENNNNVKKEPKSVVPDSSDFQFFEYAASENSAFQRIQRTSYRYQPYTFNDRVTSSQVQCDKCGFVCEVNLMVEHEAQAHPVFSYEFRDDESQAEILDLDSQKVVYQSPGDENPPWLDRRYFKEENGNQSPDFGSVSTTMSSPSSSSEIHYFDPPQVMHLSSSQLPKYPVMSPKGSGGSWKSNEARRPKTYNCSACNKWFTSSGHLKRHYNTTLHKNAVKQSGMIDPANLPMSSTHHQTTSQQVSPLPEEKFYIEQPSPQMPPQMPSPQPQPQPQPQATPLQLQHIQLHHLAQLQPPHQPPHPHHIPEDFQEYYGYPNGMPPHALSFNEPLPSFAQFASSLGGFSVGGLHQPFVENDFPEVSSSVVTPPPAPEPVFQHHHQNEPTVHKCLDCDKTFNKACYLTQHNKSFHSGDKPYKCVRCGKRFTESKEHLEHLSKHAGDKPFKCEMCPKQFNHKTDLRRHMCLHSGDKPYSCDYCGKGFIRKDHMLKHADTHKKKAVSSGLKKMDTTEPHLHLRAI